MIMPESRLRLGLITIFLALPASGLAIIASQRSTGVKHDSAYGTEIEKWRTERLEEINGEDGWNTLVGLFWLNEGKNKFGSDQSNDIVLPPDRAKKFAGVLWREGDAVRLEASAEAGITIDGKAAGSLVLQHGDDKPTVLVMSSLSLFVIKRGEKLGLRVKDKLHPARSLFTGLHYFPIDPGWRVEARFDPYQPPKTIPIANVLGMVDDMISPGALVFELGGKTYRLDPVLEKGSKQLFVIFADKTNGNQTYGAGRYLYVEPPDANGKVIVDFNKAHNPPCAFTRFATCPLPPRQNRLAVRVLAGEKKYAGGH
ncbi:MAG: DUF1684 domain-containing protein [Blastocatellia bacterium]